MKVWLLIFILFLYGCSTRSWREASRESAGIALPASEVKEDVYQIYYARAFSWKGYFGIHPWVAWKRKSDSQYTVAQVTAWNKYRTGTTVQIEQDFPDRYWFDSRPTIMFELRGQKALKAIEETEKLIESYPFRDTYRVWPGPNSNTFIAYLTRNIDVLKLELPSSAIGKDYLGTTQFFAVTPSGTGFQFSVLGALGFTLGLSEGIEINVLGVSLGIDFWTPALKLPLYGRLGFKDKEI